MNNKAYDREHVRRVILAYGFRTAVLDLVSITDLSEREATKIVREIHDEDAKPREWKSIKWSPFVTNVLDAPKYDLCLPDGTPVEFYRRGVKFVLVARGVPFETDDNLQMSYRMNQLEIGGCLRQEE